MERPGGARELSEIPDTGPGSLVALMQVSSTWRASFDAAIWRAAMGSIIVRAS
jgi:hypothetical protein